MPVFTAGDPWGKDYYKKELLDLIKQDLKSLEREHGKLKHYEEIRIREIKQVQAKYNFKPRDLQKFIDFGLCLDARNEAEYLVSLAGFYLLPIHKEIARRLFISVKQLRNLVKPEVISCLEGGLKLLKFWQGKLVSGAGYLINLCFR